MLVHKSKVKQKHHVRHQILDVVILPWILSCNLIMPNLNGENFVQKFSEMWGTNYCPANLWILTCHIRQVPWLLLNYAWLQLRLYNIGLFCFLWKNYVKHGSQSPGLQYLVILFGVSCPCECQDSSRMSLCGHFVCLFRHFFSHNLFWNLETSY